ncbi:D-alanyl-D-alanine carboxypeptidase family protein [Humidisolicoccus flavus]|uniref:D-alanyl-D-alanine carboxypeptidase family protein n=1 Tax=Humidisolicoccus flavus TaxID=3111414 RepID=UPI003249980F
MTHSASTVGGRAVTANSQRKAPWWVVLGRILLAVLLIIPILYAALVALWEMPATAVAPEPVQVVSGEEPTIAWPTTGSAAAFRVVGLDGAVGASGASDPVPIASITKVITALVVLDAKPLSADSDGERIVLGEADVASMSTMLQQQSNYFSAAVGRTVSQRDLLEWALVHSAGNAADSLAIWAFGSIDQFLDASKQWLSDHGFESIVLADANGLSADNIATASELARIGELAMDNAEIRKTVALTRIDVPGIGWVGNSNSLLGVDGITGIKTGNLFISGRNLLASANYQHNGTTYRIIVVVLGHVSVDARNEATRTLLASIGPNIRTEEILPRGTAVANVEAPWGRSASVVTANAVSADFWGSVETSVEVDLPAVTKTRTGTNAGEALVRTGSLEHTVQLEWNGMFIGPDYWWKFTHPVELFESWQRQ